MVTLLRNLRDLWREFTMIDVVVIPKGHKEFKMGTITGDYNLSILVKDKDGNPWKIRILKWTSP